MLFFFYRDNSWKIISVSGNKPDKRAFHSMVTDINMENLYIYGGVTNKNNQYIYCNDLWKFSIANERWEQVSYFGIKNYVRNVLLWDSSKLSVIIPPNETQSGDSTSKEKVRENFLN